MSCEKGGCCSLWDMNTNTTIKYNNQVHYHLSRNTVTGDVVVSSDYAGMHQLKGKYHGVFDIFC